MSGRHRNDGGEITYHSQVVRQAAWVREHGDTLLRAHELLPASDVKKRLTHVIRSLEMDHIVVPEELTWALTLSEETLS